MSTTRRLGGGSTPAAHTTTQPPAQPAARPTPQPVRPPPANAPTARRAIAGAAGLPPPPQDVDTSQRPQSFERRDDAYWLDHPLRAGTYEWDVVVSKVVAWASGGVDVTLRVVQWDADANRPGIHHDRTIKWEQTREDLLRRWNSEGEDGEKARRGYAYWRSDLVGAYTACGWPEESWPKAGDSPVPPWWLFFVHQCPDGIVVPVVLSAKVVVQPKRERWPAISEVRVIRSSTDDRPFQAPLPYCVPASLADEHRWPIAEMKWFSDKAEVALVDRNAIPFPHAGLLTYKELS